MSSTILTSGDLNNGVALSSGNDGTVIIQSGLAGAKVNALSISPAGNISLLAAAAPCFSAYTTSNRAIPSGAFTKIILDAKEFDTANAFDSGANFRFTPQVAGYYQVTGAIYFSASGAATRAAIAIYKNGIQFKVGEDVSSGLSAVVGGLVFMNGLTDYIELWGLVVATTPLINSGAPLTYFQAAFIRSA